jgi:hypothetical protein
MAIGRKPMAETIEVRYKQINVIVRENGWFPGLAWSPRPVFHKYFVYTDANGNEWEARGGPSGVPALFAPMGYIETYHGPHTPEVVDAHGNTLREDSPDWDSEGDDPSELFMRGSDLSDVWQHICDIMDDVQARNIPYELLGPNSNSVVDHVHHVLGVDEPVMDGFKDYWAPGSGIPLDSLFPYGLNPEDRKPSGGGGAWMGPGGLVASAGAAAAIALPRIDPLALDLDGDGIETVSDRDGVILFDHNADGIKTGTGWLTRDDGWLVLDRNGNGTIDSGRELFGVDTILSSGVNASDGFAALREFDLNKDGSSMPWIRYSWICAYGGTRTWMA